MNERLKEIEKRMKRIGELSNSEGADLDALTVETDALIAEKRKIEGEIEKRRSILSKVSSGAFGTGETFMQNEPEKREFDRSSAEYRSAFLKKIRDIELSDVEKRAFSSVADSAKAVIPTTISDEIVKRIKQQAPLLEEITLLSVPGNVKFAVEKPTNPDAKKHDENSTLTADEDGLAEVNLSAYEINKLIQVSKTVSEMSAGAFEEWLVEMLAEKVAQKINAYLINGTGENEPMGIDSAAEWDETNSVTLSSGATLKTTDVTELIGKRDGAYDRHAKFIMSKKTLFTDFMPLRDSAKNNLVTNEGHDYFIYGYPVLLDSNVKTHEAYLGDLTKIVGNLAEDINVVSNFDIRTNSFLYLGSALFDSAVAIEEAFVKLKAEE